MSALTDTRDQMRARYAKLDARERQMVVGNALRII